jgi:hypothetical protein
MQNTIKTENYQHSIIANCCFNERILGQPVQADVTTQLTGHSQTAQTPVYKLTLQHT